MAFRIKFLMLGSLLGTSIIFSSNSLATACPEPSAYPFNGCSLPGLVRGSFPYFEQGVEVNYKTKHYGFGVKAKYDKDSSLSSFLKDPADILDITGTKLKFKARVKDSIANGNIKIRGSIDAIGVTKRSTLMTADLTGLWAMGEAGTLLGFNTENIVCHNAINAYLGGDGCTQREVIYLTLQDAITPGTKKLKTTALALTSVPIPTSIWLFGSGLLGLIGIARRKKVS